ncbi:hypothetical protein PybrP1_012378 [[Pythium] brassicae (nom. inval.)]|nr:hypothetical protein PybrP1_012378 [[Pythium] brassicae (nom. inval.)]
MPPNEYMSDVIFFFTDQLVVILIVVILGALVLLFSSAGMGAGGFSGSCDCFGCFRVGRVFGGPAFVSDPPQPALMLCLSGFMQREDFEMWRRRHLHFQAPEVDADKFAEYTPLCAASIGVPGGWYQAPVTGKDSALLSRTLTNEASYGADVTERVCVLSIDSLTQQVVAGLNYRFEVLGCKVASAASAGFCKGKPPAHQAGKCYKYAIQLYVQVWTNTFKVTSIKQLSV